MRRKQALAGSHDGAAAVTFDAAALKHKVQVALVMSLQDILFCHPPADIVVKVSREFLSPTIELEIEQTRAVWREQRDEAVITSPSVVGRSLAERNVLQAPGRQLLFKQQSNPIGLRSNNDKPFVCRYCLCHIKIATGHLLQNRAPIGGIMRPRQLHGTLFVPFCRQESPPSGSSFWGMI